MDTRTVMRSLKLAGLSNLIGLLLLATTGGADTGGWLITPEEAAMAPAADVTRGILEIGREDLSVGPVIDVVEPSNGSRLPMPVHVLIHFAPFSEPVDLASLKVVLIKFILVDITDRIRPYVTPEGIQVKEAKIPPGKHRVRITLADQAGTISIKEVSFEVL
ncbi:MAG: hypothetical protein KGS09_19830 [Nitrospirae bacterium]|nr:hypothetical protein [Nitrospirota bacterium]MBU6482778.1 hypothetical protein [Nitrospirota bacterium]MDE3042878.1 hypothetical protein [Nitrospirota bacterium]MDE3052114.1 hypothetical protein [Nitrospirota bacterium]MDE3220202.1 hypothetical protein [Nitrospirota bacterium]